MGKEKSLATVPPKKVGKSWLSKTIARGGENKWLILKFK